MGRFLEFFQPGDAEVAQRLGHAGIAIRRLLGEGQSVVLVREGEQNLEWVRERGPVYRFEVLKAS